MKRHGTSLRRHLLPAVVVLAALASLGTGCATNPVTGKREFSLVSEQQEMQLGKEGHSAVLEEYGVLEDPKLAAYVDSVGQSLARRSHLPNLKWTFTVLDDPAVNAFALPGGYIYVTRGIMAHLGSEAQLAGVLGHEIGHVTARHSAQRVTSQQLAGIGLGIASIVSEDFQRYGQVAQQALGLLLLKYSRDNENEADALGIDYAVAAGWDPREVPATYVTLRRVGEKAGQRLPGFLSTHPDPGDREVRTRGLAQKAATGRTGLQVRSRDYLRRLEGVAYGADPRQGYFEGQRFFHPQLDFELAFPSGWKTQNQRSAVVAAEPNERGVMQLSLVNAEGLTPSGYVNRLVNTRKVSGARGGEERVGGLLAWVGRLVTTAADGSEVSFAAAYIQSGERTFEVLGRAASATEESAILAAARSFRPLADAARRSATADRLRLASVTTAGAFDEVLPKLGPNAIALEESSILNGLEPGESVMRGQMLKLVTPGRRK